MQILNPDIHTALKRAEPLRLELGCGPKPREGFVAVDLLAMDGVDIQADLNEPLASLPDNSVAEVYTRHTFEHVRNITGLMTELHRVLIPGGRLEIIVPHFTNPYFYSDPTHVTAFGVYTMNYFLDPEQQPTRKVPAFYTNARFELEKLHLRFYRQTWLDRRIGPWVERYVNRKFERLDTYERRWWWLFHAWEVQWVLHPVK